MREVSLEEIKSHNPKSYGENAVIYELLRRDIEFSMEKTYPDLYGDHAKLRFDFFVHGKNRDFLIEVDGTQHRLKKRFTTKNLARYDKMKDDYCRDHGIQLYRIKYCSGSTKYVHMHMKNILRLEGFDV